MGNIICYKIVKWKGIGIREIEGLWGDNVRWIRGKETVETFIEIEFIIVCAKNALRFVNIFYDVSWDLSDF